MNLKTLSIPDSISEIGAWLDDLLVSPDLLDSIVELEVIAGDRLSTVQSLDGILDGDRGNVLESGLASVNETTLRSLLRQPALLLELQEQVMMHGGDYWQTKADRTFGKGKTPANFAPTNSNGQSDRVASGNSAKGSGGKQVVEKARSSWAQPKIIAAIAAVAAALLIMFSIPFINSGPSVAKANWGFAKSGLLKSEISEVEMLDQLARASATWHNKVPSNREQLEKRLREFDFGCETLIGSNLPQLSSANRSAVHQACKECRNAIAEQLASLKSGGDLRAIQFDANKAIDRLTNSINRLG